MTPVECMYHSNGRCRRPGAKEGCTAQRQRTGIGAFIKGACGKDMRLADQLPKPKATSK